MLKLLNNIWNSLNWFLKIQIKLIKNWRYIKNCIFLESSIFSMEIDLWVNKLYKLKNYYFRKSANYKFFNTTLDTGVSKNRDFHPTDCGISRHPGKWCANASCAASLICGRLYDRFGVSATSNARVVYIIEVLGSRKQYEAGAARTSKRCRPGAPRVPLVPPSRAPVNDTERELPQFWWPPQRTCLLGCWEDRGGRTEKMHRGNAEGRARCTVPISKDAENAISKIMRDMVCVNRNVVGWSVWRQNGTLCPFNAAAMAEWSHEISTTHPC